VEGRGRVFFEGKSPSFLPGKKKKKKEIIKS